MDFIKFAAGVLAVFIGAAFVSGGLAVFAGLGAWWLQQLIAKC